MKKFIYPCCAKKQMLTERELDILQRRARGENQKTIARALKISQAAVSQFETNAHRKILEMARTQELLKELGVHTTTGMGGTRVIYGGRK